MPPEGSSPPLTLSFLPPKPCYIELRPKNYCWGKWDKFHCDPTKFLAQCCLWFLTHSTVFAGSLLATGFPLSPHLKGRSFSAEQMVSKEQCPAKSHCANHIVQSLIVAALVDESVSWSGFLRFPGTCLTSPVKCFSPGLSEKGNEGYWLVGLKKSGSTRGSGQPCMFPLPILLAGGRGGRYICSESSEQQDAEGCVDSPDCCCSAASSTSVYSYAF